MSIGDTVHQVVATVFPAGKEAEDLHCGDCGVRAEW